MNGGFLFASVFTPLFTLYSLKNKRLNLVNLLQNRSSTYTQSHHYFGVSKYFMEQNVKVLVLLRLA